MYVSMNQHYLIAEDQGMAIFALTLTHPSSIDITTTVESSDITTNGENIITAY